MLYLPADATVPCASLLFDIANKKAQTRKCANQQTRPLLP